LTIEFDYFINKRSQALIRLSGSIPQSCGISGLLRPVNLGKIDNRGYEFKIGYADVVNEFSYSVSLNGGYAKNKIVYWDEAPGVPDHQRSTGATFGSNGVAYLAYVYDGVFIDQ